MEGNLEMFLQDIFSDDVLVGFISHFGIHVYVRKETQILYEAEHNTNSIINAINSEWSDFFRKILSFKPVESKGVEVERV